MSIIEVKNVTFTYCPGTPYERKSLNDITFAVERGTVLGIVGENGSGKSTLIKHFNGLLHPTNGMLRIFGQDVSNKLVRNELWRKVGMIFQFPEQQLFEDTVFNEIAYGLKNLGICKEEIPSRVTEALRQVGLYDESIQKFPPMCLSGGIRRRVAIASILAMQPEILILDEPTAGLDAVGCSEVTDIIKKIKDDSSATIIIVSHDMNELISVCSHLLVLKDGKLISFGSVHDVLNDKIVQDTYYNLYPDTIQLIHRLSKRYQYINSNAVSIEEIEVELHRILSRGVKK